MKKFTFAVLAVILPLSLFLAGCKLNTPSGKLILADIDRPNDEVFTIIDVSTKTPSTITVKDSIWFQTEHDGHLYFRGNVNNNIIEVTNGVVTASIPLPQADGKNQSQYNIGSYEWQIRYGKRTQINNFTAYKLTGQKFDQTMNIDFSLKEWQGLGTVYAVKTNENSQKAIVQMIDDNLNAKFFVFDNLSKKISQILFDPNTDIYLNEFAPNTNEFVYRSYRLSKFCVGLKNLDNGSSRELYCGNPKFVRFSPNNNFLAVTYTKTDNTSVTPAGLVIVNLADPKAPIVNIPVLNLVSFTWSPDGNSIAVIHDLNQSNTEISIFDTQGKTKQTIDMVGFPYWINWIK